MRMQYFLLNGYAQKVSTSTVTSSMLKLHVIPFSVETDESLFLLATCYFRSGRVNEAHWLLSTKGAATQKSRFLLAKCAFELKQ